MRRSFRLLAILSTLGLVLAGCGKSPPPAAPEKSPAAPATTADKSHSHGEGPHGGTVADWGGGEYHVEFKVDHKTREATVYVLDNNAKKPAAIKANKLLLSIAMPSFQVELLPSPLEGETDGMCSRFVGKHEKLGIVQEFSGTISGEADGTPYAGEFKEHAHDH